MNAFGLRVTGRLLGFPHLLLASHLLVLHLNAFGGWEGLSTRLLWPVAMGLFLLWQPFVEGSQRVSRLQSVLLLGMVAASTLGLNAWLLLIWCGTLAAIVGGRVAATPRRFEQSGYLFAFGYLHCLAIFGIMPELAPGAVSLDPLTRHAIRLFMPLFLPLLLLFPAERPRHSTEENFDAFYGIVLFLLLAVFFLGSLVYTMAGRVSYLESVLRTSFSLAGALLLIAWAWNPRSGFAGAGAAFSRHLVSLAMPLPQWLALLNRESEREANPERFLGATLRALMTLPGIAGGRWQVGQAGGACGSATPFVHEYQRETPVRVALFFRHAPSPALLWHADILLRLAAEFSLVKHHAEELRRVGYLQAVYETGTRVTHDVKNLLQSLQTLCYAAASRPGDPVALTRLLGRQLPQIAERLRSTLDKLQRPPDTSDDWVTSAIWWEALQERYTGEPIRWMTEGDIHDISIPGGLFDSVAENLLQNALSKARREERVEVVAELWGHAANVVFRVRDTGSPVAPALARELFRQPVLSENGLGIGLYHAAHQAATLGFTLTLAQNQGGSVSFVLSGPPR